MGAGVSEAKNGICVTVGGSTVSGNGTGAQETAEMEERINNKMIFFIRCPTPVLR
jgi:hypothetical protein